MTLTRDFKETIRDRISRDPTFHVELLREGIACVFTGDLATAEVILHDWSA